MPELGRILSIYVSPITLFVLGALSRACALEVDEWKTVAETFACCPCLRELSDFGWSRAVLVPGVVDLDLDRRDLGDVQAVVLGALLPRTASALTALRLWCALLLAPIALPFEVTIN